MKCQLSFSISQLISYFVSALSLVQLILSVHRIPWTLIQQRMAYVTIQSFLCWIAILVLVATYAAKEKTMAFAISICLRTCILVWNVVYGGCIVVRLRYSMTSFRLRSIHNALEC